DGKIPVALRAGVFGGRIGSRSFVGGQTDDSNGHTGSTKREEFGFQHGQGLRAFGRGFKREVVSGSARGASQFLASSSARKFRPGFRSAVVAKPSRSKSEFTNAPDNSIHAGLALPNPLRLILWTQSRSIENPNGTPSQPKGCKKVRCALRRVTTVCCGEKRTTHDSN